MCSDRMPVPSNQPNEKLLSFVAKRLFPASQKREQTAGEKETPSHFLVAKSSPRRSFYHRLVWEHVTILVAALLVIESCIYALASYYLLAHTDDLLRAEGKRLQGATQMWLAGGHPSGEALLNWLVNQNQTDEFSSYPPSLKLFDPQTSAVLKRPASPERTRISFHRNDFLSALRGQQTLSTYQDSRGREVRILTLPLRDSASRTVVIAQISLSLEAVKQVQILLAVLLIGGALSALIIAYSFGSFLTRRALRPLTCLSQKMYEVAATERHFPLAPPQQTSEMHMLSTAFNQMVGRLEASFLLQENFLADISHELRTPLAALRGQIDMLLLDPKQDEEARQDLHQVQAEIDRLSRLVANLLTNARLEVSIFPQPVKHATRVDLVELLFEIIRQMHFVKPQVAICFGQFQPIEVDGDRDLLKQLFLNLMDNAVTYTPAGGRVTIDITAPDEAGTGKQQSRVRVALCDTGPGINEKDLPHLFERHYGATDRVGWAKQNSGLGLSIALVLAQAHEGTITAENRPGGGACFTVWLPTSCAPESILNGDTDKQDQTRGLYPVPDY